MHIFNIAVASLATTVKGSYQVYLPRNTVGAHFCTCVTWDEGP